MRDRGGMVEVINPFKLMLVPEIIPESKDSLPTVSQPAPVKEELPQEKETVKGKELLHEKEPVKEEELPKPTQKKPLKSKSTRKK
jgi:hypothetical protein